MHADLALCGEMRDEIGVFGGDGSSGDAGRITESGMGQPEVGAAYRTDEGGDSAQFRRGLGTGGAIAHGLSIGDERQSRRRFLLVEDFVEENDFAGDIFAAQGLQFVEIVDDDHIRGDAVRQAWRYFRPRQSEQLSACVPADLPGVFGELGGFRATNPVRNFDFFQLHIEPELAEFGWRHSRLRLWPVAEPAGPRARCFRSRCATCR